MSLAVDAIAPDIPGVRLLTDAVAPLLDDLFVRCTAFVRLIEGREPAVGDGLKLLHDLPPNVSPDIKRNFGLFDGGQLVGVIEMLLGHPDPSVWYIGLLMLDPGVRGQGRGEGIVRAIGDWALTSGAASLRIAVQEQNVGGLRFWRRQGFQPLYTVENHLTGALESTVFVMGLDLSSRPSAYPTDPLIPAKAGTQAGLGCRAGSWPDIQTASS